MSLDIKSMAELKNFTTPDEVRTFLKGRLELIKIDEANGERGVWCRRACAFVGETVPQTVF